jgi:hypothetical protein
MKPASLLILVFSLASNMVSAQTHQLVKKWETDSVFKVPESVLFDAKNNVLYASNIDGTDPWAKDGKGSIGKLGVDGKVISAEWVPGLDAPKGMGVFNDMLYVADIDNVVVIDIKKGSIDRKIPVNGAQGLNDLTIDSKGVVYVSDSKINKIFRIENKVQAIFVDSLKGANGVLMNGNDFYFLDAGGMYKLGKDKQKVKITDGMEGGTDGIENVKGNDFLVSCWAGVIWYVNADGTKEKLLDTREQKKNSADIGFDPKTKTVFVPTFWRNSVVAYEVK